MALAVLSFVVLLIPVHLSTPFRITSVARGQFYDFPSASEATPVDGTYHTNTLRNVNVTIKIILKPNRIHLYITLYGQPYVT